MKRTKGRKILQKKIRGKGKNMEKWNKKEERKEKNEEERKILEQIRIKTKKEKNEEKNMYKAKE